MYCSSDINLPLELNASQWDLMGYVLTILIIFDDATFATTTATVIVSEITPIINSIKRLF